LRRQNMNKNVNSIIQVNDGKYAVTETLEQIQEQSQKGKLLFLHANESDSNKIHPVLVNVNEVAVAMSAKEVKEATHSMAQKIETEAGGEEFLKGFAAYLYNKFND
ncbi:hypothetical protein, partial [Limosilactobacillus equigenerosi]